MCTDYKSAPAYDSGGMLLLFGMKFENMNENIQMNQLKLLVIIVFVFAQSSCGSISFVPASEKPPTKNHMVSSDGILDKYGNVIVKSGSNRDIRKGYYFDTKEGKCKQVFYSTGPNCVHPPFKTMEECLSFN